jgi:DNA-binding transcriptional MerR regulator
LEKAPDAFRTISEVAEEISVPQHVLRFWESRFTQIRPMKRGGGRRYYRPDDVDLLRGVRHLLYGEGYTIRGVQRILREEGIAFVQDVWRAGSTPPPPQVEDDQVSEDEVEAGGEAKSDGEPTLRGFTAGQPKGRANQPPPAKREPTLGPPAASEAVASRSLNDEERAKLRGALEDLVACRRMIDAALSVDYSDESVSA